MSTLLAVDVGGTFTDLVMLDADTGDVRFAKTLTTAEPEQGVHAVVERNAIDIDQIIERVLEGLATRNYGPLPVGNAGYNPDVEQFG